MQKYGIEPLVTLSHYETPYHLAKKYDGWKSRDLMGFYENMFEQYLLVIKERFIIGLHLMKLIVFGISL